MGTQLQMLCSVRSSPELRRVPVCPCALCAAGRLAVRSVRLTKQILLHRPIHRPHQIRSVLLCPVHNPAPPDRRGREGCCGKRDCDQTETWRDGPLHTSALLAERSKMHACVP